MKPSTEDRAGSYPRIKREAQSITPEPCLLEASVFCETINFLVVYAIMSQDLQLFGPKSILSNGQVALKFMHSIHLVLGNRSDFPIHDSLEIVCRRWRKGLLETDSWSGKEET